jgi:hypothetical protein
VHVVDELPRRLCRWGVAAAAAAVALQTVVYLGDVQLSGHEPHLLDADGDFSAWAWASACAVFCGALASLGVAATTAARRRAEIGVAVILAFLSLDETVGIHERLTNDLPDRLGVPLYFARAIWPAVYLPLLVLLAVLLVTASRRLAAGPARLVRLGLGLLVVAVLAEVASTVLIADGETLHSAPYVVEVAVEEGCELGGWMLIATAMVAGVTAQLLALGRRAAFA